MLPIHRGFFRLGYRGAKAVTDLARRARPFIGSYALLFVLLALRFTTPWVEWVCGGLASIGILDTVVDCLDRVQEDGCRADFGG